MKTKLLITILALSYFPFVLEAQEIPANDSIPPLGLDTLGLPMDIDSSGFVFDTTFRQNDSLATITSSVAKVEYSKDSLEQEVESYGHDSMRYDIANKLIHLWGDAYVIYGDIKLQADYIVYNWTDNIVTAEYSEDSLGNRKGRPEFTDKTQTFTANKMRYNFKTGKGVVLDAVSTYDDMYIHGGKVKMFGAGADSTHAHEHIYSENAIFTTCNHPNPHFGICSRKQKVIPDKVVIVGPSNLQVGGVPTPIWLPFGFFPLKQGDRTGLVFGDYEYSEQFGFGLRDFGWYFPINDYMNLTLTGDIYTRGTWELKANSQYKKRYKYSGSANLSFLDRRVESGIKYVHDRSFRFSWNHQQDAKAHPTNSLSGRINLQSNNSQSKAETDADAVFNNTLGSSMTFRKTFPGKPYNITASFTHSQNNQTGKVDISFPNLDFSMRTIYPFKNEERGENKERWYEKIGVNYGAKAKNRFLTSDTTIFTQQTLDDARFGVSQTASADVNFKILKYFSLRPNVNYTGVSHFRTLNKVFDPTPTLDTIYTDEMVIDHIDTISYGTVEELTDTGFKQLNLFNAGVDLNTKLFGLIQFKKGWLRGLRHTATPRIGLSYTPDYTNDAFGYFKEVQTSTEDDVEAQQYSIFTGGVYGPNPSSAGRQMRLSYGLANNFEGKYYSKKDSTFHKFKIFDNINLSGSYNYAADSLRFSTIGASARTKLIPNGISSLVLSATFDPYIIENNRRVNKLVWDKRRKPFRFSTANATISTRFSVKQIANLLTGKKVGSNNNGRNNREKKEGLGNESLLSLIDNFNFNHNIKTTMQRIGDGTNQRDTVFVSVHSITLKGNLQLTNKWRMTLSQISYNFKTKRLVYPQIGLSRELHCWQMEIGWTPAANASFTFSLKVKPGTLDFIKVPYGRNKFDAPNVNRF